MNPNDWFAYNKKERQEEPHQESEEKIPQPPQDFDLAYVVEYYPAALESRAKLAATLHDLYPTEKIKTNLALAAYGCGVVSRISSAESLSPQMVGSFVRQMQCDYGVTEENAVLSVKLWAIAYHIEMPHQEARVETANVAPVKRESRPASNVPFVSTQIVKSHPIPANTKSSDYEIGFLDDNSAIIKKFIGLDNSVMVVPNMVNGYKIVGIKDGAYSNCKTLVNLTVSIGIKTIGVKTANTNTGVFEGCYNLSSIMIPNGVELLGNRVFNGCKQLDAIYLPKSVKFIGDDAFNNSGVKNIRLNEGLKAIGNRAFMGSNQTSFLIPSTVESIGDSAFGEPCSKIDGEVVRIELYCYAGSPALRWARKNGYIVRNAADWPN